MRILRPLRGYLERAYEAAAGPVNAKIIACLQDNQKISAELLSTVGQLAHDFASRGSQAGPSTAIPDGADQDDLRGSRAFDEWCRFYESREAHYAEIAKELGSHHDAYSTWYKKGGYGYEPSQARLWLVRETSLPDYRGTCLDIGSGDGFWSWILSDWYHVTGVEPMPGVIELANAIKRRLPISIQRRVDFKVGDALETKDPYDVVFCRAPSFFNYPIFKSFDPAMLDPDRLRLHAFHAERDPATANARTQKYSSVALSAADVAYQHEYAGHWKEYLERMLTITGKMFVFIMWTSPAHYGTYVGNTYCHDPDEVQRLFEKYGHSKTRLDTSGSYVVGEIYK